MKVSEFRDICDALGKYATTREKATGSESKIGVQVANGVLKFIASSGDAGVVVAAGPHEGRFVYTVDARPFLQSAKALPAKQNVDLSVDKDGLTIIAEGGGRIKMNPAGTMEGFTRKPKEFTASVPVPATSFAQIAKVFKAVSGKIEVPSIQIVDGAAHIVAVAPGNRPMYASVMLPGAIGEDGYSASATLDFWDGLRAIKSDGVIEFGRGGMLARSGTVECYSAPYLVSKYDAASGTTHASHEPQAWPLMSVPTGNEVAVKVQRSTIVTVLRGQAPFDEHNRVTLRVAGGLLSVSAFGSTAEQSIPVEARGAGTKSVRSDYLTSILSNLDGKEVVLKWGSGTTAISVHAKEHSDWTILLAPVAI